MTRADRPTIDHYPYRVALTTRWMDNDIYGHINNVAYYSFFDTAANQFLIERGKLDIAAGRKGYVHLARGSATVNGERLSAGDALKTEGGEIRIASGDGAEVLVFDLPAE